MGTSRIIGSLDNWLTSHGVDHPYIRPVIRNQVLLTLIVFVIGLAAAFASPWILWADAGIAVMTVIICSWTRYFHGRQNSREQCPSCGCVKDNRRHPPHPAFFFF